MKGMKKQMIQVLKLANEHWFVERHLHSDISKKAAALQGITHFNKNHFIGKRSEIFFTFKLFTRWHCNQMGVTSITYNTFEKTAYPTTFKF